MARKSLIVRDGGRKIRRSTSSTGPAQEVDRGSASPQGAKAELDWFLRNFDELVKTYPDQWLVIQGQKVVANATSPAELQARIQTLGISRPFVARSHPDAWLGVK